MLKRMYKVVASSNENGVYKRKIVKHGLKYNEAKIYANEFEKFDFKCLIITTKREPIV